MVNLYKLMMRPPLEPQVHHSYGPRDDRRGRFEPKGTHELEVLAERAYRLTSSIVQPAVTREGMTSLLRLQFNLNFVMLCEKCHGPHHHQFDELEAPDR